MKIEELKKYFGKMVIIEISTNKNNTINKKLVGRLVKWLNRPGTGFVEVEKGQTGKYVEIKVWNTGDSSQNQQLKKVFKTVLKISKIKSIKLCQQN